MAARGDGQSAKDERSAHDGDLRMSPRTAAISRVPTVINVAPAAKKQKDLSRND